MAGPSTKPYNVGTLRSKLMRPALTSHYICRFQPPQNTVGKWMNLRSRSGLSGENYRGETQELIELSCSDASLPGSSLNTNEMNDDYTGVTQKFAYRRLYDSTADFTFYVDRDYKIISFFEGWLSYITKEEYNNGLLLQRNYFYRARFPDTYRTDELYITKFEKDTGTRYNGGCIEYKFIGAYPVSITSMPVSYDQSQLLKCTVSFTYDRYVMYRTRQPLPTPPPPAPGNPEIPPPPAAQPIPFDTSRLERDYGVYYNNGINGTNFNQTQAPGDPRQDSTNSRNFFSGRNDRFIGLDRTPGQA